MKALRTIASSSNRRAMFTARRLSILLICALSYIASVADAAVDLTGLDRIEVQPRELTLHSGREQGMLLVTGYFADGRVADLTREAAIESSDEKVAGVHSGTVQPKGDGTNEVVVRVGAHQVKVPVSVTGAGQPSPVSFRTETVAVLTRHGCNSGACHGSPSGKGGFLLSLQAYDFELDERSLTRDDLGRRINSIEPEQSLLLLKPTRGVPHAGGLRLRTTDHGYDVLRQWIAEGARVDEPNGTQCIRLELLPASGRVLELPHAEQQLVARAHFEDGTIRDVTRLTLFTSSDEHIGSVTESGLLVGKRRGPVAVMARYLDQLVSCQFTVVEDVDGFQWSDPPTNNYIDELVYEKLRQLQYPPAELCSDTDFVRRVYLDVLGKLPTITEQDAFFADGRDDRRAQLIDQLLERPEYARFWALKWADLLRLQKAEISESGVHKFHNWLVHAVQSNMSFAQFARELLTAQGSTYDHPAANYYRACDEPIQAAETTAQLFLGSRIQCAKCHNHPFENWTQDNFYGLTAFFSRVARKPGPRLDEAIVYVARAGEVQQPRTGKTMRPWLPGAGEVADETIRDRRMALVDWLTRPDNPMFARVAVNRMWAEVMGRGIVDPVDDFRQSNPPSIPALLDRLAEDFVSHDFDQKHILRTILNSRIYQLDSQPNELNRDDMRFFSHARMRMLSAEQLLDAICQVTEVDESFVGLPAQTRAVDIPSPDFDHEFLDTFGRPPRNTACECERGAQATLSQVVELFNGPLVREKLANKENRFRRLVAEGLPTDKVIIEMYRAAVCRQPSDTELKSALDYVAAEENVADGFEDLGWVLLNSDEFLTQH